MGKSEESARSARDQMMREVVRGAESGVTIDFSAEHVLARGCDPLMALRASKLMPTLLGGVQFVSCTDDDEFIAKLRERSWSVVFFAPGACRYHAAGLAIPGARSHTEGWGLEEYRALVRRHQGDEIQIVETSDEREVVQRLREALLHSRESHERDR